jgi:pyruvate kinase
MLDTKGPEIRTGFFANGVKKISLNKGDTIILTSDYEHKGDAKKLACSYSSLAKSVKPGQEILVADGSLVLSVVSTDVSAGEVVCKIENNASIGERKNMNLPGVIVDLPTLTDKDIDDIRNWGIPNQIDFIAASFVRKASDIQKIREVLGEEGKGIKIISKIENQEGMQNYDEILEATDAVMVARGDLGMEIPPEKVFLAQKMLIRKANIAGKPVVTATQMLESMITNPRPTRAECSDVANAVLDGTDCVMLSGETANGEYPTAAVSIMGYTCCEAESAQSTDMLYQAVLNSTLSQYGTLSTSESIASSAAKTAVDVNAKAIIVCSESGTTATQVAKFRPGRPIQVLTTSERVARQCYGLLRSCDAQTMESLADMHTYIEKYIEEFKATGQAQKGDAFVIVTGTITQKGATNLLRVQYA